LRVARVALALTAAWLVASVVCCAALGRFGSIGFASIGSVGRTKGFGSIGSIRGVALLLALPRLLSRSCLRLRLRLGLRLCR
jgi:hypothetical protein